MAILASNDSPRELLKLREGPKLVPPLALLANIISVPPALLSSHTTYTLFPETATSGLAEFPALLLRFFALVKLAPLSELLANITSEFDAPAAVLFIPTLSHTTYTLFPETATSGLAES